MLHNLQRVRHRWGVHGDRAGQKGRWCAVLLRQRHRLREGASTRRAAWREAGLGVAAGLALVAAALVLPATPAPAVVAVGLEGTTQRSGSVHLAGSGESGAQGVDFINEADGWAVVGGPLCGYAPGDMSAGPPCVIMATTDGGSEWQPVFQTTAQLNGLDFADPLHGLAWGPDALLGTADGATGPRSRASPRCRPASTSLP